MYGNNFRRIVNGSVISVRYSKNDSTKRLLDVLGNMPKPQTSRIAEAQRQRKQISKKGEKYSPSVVYLQVLGSGARGVPNTLYMFTDQKRYLFNCGEGTQRLAHEHKVKLSRLNHIFITNKTWRNIGGLPGLSLTLQDVGVPNITLHGPKGLDELYNATKRFVIMKNMEVSMAKCSPTDDFEDGVMTVKYIYLSPHDTVLDIKDLRNPAKRQKLNELESEEYKEFITDDIDYYNPQSYQKKVQQKLNEKVEKSKVKPAPKPQEFSKHEKVVIDLRKATDCTVAYICTLKKRFGTLNLEKCVEMGVKPGPLLGQLKAGHDVILPDGKLVFASDVKTPDDPGPVFIVIEVPEISYLKSSEFCMYFDNGINPPENIPALIVHFTPPEVFNLPEYQNFMTQFGPTTQHLVLNARNSCLGSEAVHRTQHRLHLLDPDIFPLLRDVSIPAIWNSNSSNSKVDSTKLKCWEDLKNKIAMAQFQTIIDMASNIKESSVASETQIVSDPPVPIEARTLTTFHLRPKKELDRSLEPKLHVQDYIQEAMDADGFANSLEQFRRVAESSKSNLTSSEYPKVVFLGTGSCIPSKTRNTSAIVVQVDEQHSILLDCGEGTFSQLVRFYSQKRINNFLRTLRGIYISHLHADHHIGLITLLQERRSAFKEAGEDAALSPLYLLAPGQIMSWLAVYDQKFERIRHDFILVPNQSLIAERESTSVELTSVLNQLGLKEITTCLVSHCPNAFGVALTMADTKITYSGDTVPCEDLVKLGENSTLLIHEATMEDELAEEARMKMHSTTTQAIEVGKQMKANYVILTHFSQRYARLPRLNAKILNDNKSVGIAFDNMKVSMGDLHLLPHMYAPLQLMFAEHCVEMEVKAAHRALSKNRAKDSALLLIENQVVTQPKKGGGGDRCQGKKVAPVSSPMPVAVRNISNNESVNTLRRPSPRPTLTTKKKEPELLRSTSPSTTTAKLVTPKLTELKMHSAVPPALLPCIPDSSIATLPRKRSQIKATCSKIRESVSPKPAEIRSISPVNNTREFSLSTLTESGHTALTTGKETLTGTSALKIDPIKCTEKRSELSELTLKTAQEGSDSVFEKYIEKDMDDSKVNVPRAGSRKSFIPKPIGKTCLNLKETLKEEQEEQTPVYTNKGFKPQLENIQSSYILQTKHDLPSNEVKNTDSTTTRIISKRFDDKERRALLQKYKKKYSSIEYIRNTKFEKIEGLNWISWK